MMKRSWLGGWNSVPTDHVSTKDTETAPLTAGLCSPWCSWSRCGASFCRRELSSRTWSVTRFPSRGR